MHLMCSRQKPQEALDIKELDVYPHCQHECPLNSRVNVFQQCAIIVNISFKYDIQAEQMFIL